MKDLFLLYCAHCIFLKLANFGIGFFIILSCVCCASVMVKREVCKRPIIECTQISSNDAKMTLTQRECLRTYFINNGTFKIQGEQKTANNNNKTPKK